MLTFASRASTKQSFNCLAPWCYGGRGDRRRGWLRKPSMRNDWRGAVSSPHTRDDASAGPDQCTATRCRELQRAGEALHNLFITFSKLAAQVAALRDCLHSNGVRMLRLRTHVAVEVVDSVRFLVQLHRQKFQAACATYGLGPQAPRIRSFWEGLG